MLTRAALRGFTLVEVLVALGVLLAGVAGSSLLLLRSLQHERESATRRAAIRLAGSLAEELRASRRSDGAPLPAGAPLIVAWQAAAAAALPAGADIRVEPSGALPPAYRITMAWPVSGLGLQQLTLAVTT